MLNSIQEGFVKQAAQHGINEELLRACIKVAEESQALIEQTIKKAEATFGGSGFRQELHRALCKRAGIEEYVRPLQQGLMKHLGVGSDAANAILGAGGGGLTGLLGSQLLGTDPLTSLLAGAGIGGVAGDALGQFLGQGQATQPGTPAMPQQPATAADASHPFLKTLGIGGGAGAAGYGAYKYMPGVRPRVDNFASLVKNKGVGGLDKIRAFGGNVKGKTDAMFGVLSKMFKKPAI